MKILFLDLETEGLSTKARIIEIGAIVYDLFEMKELDVIGPFVRPDREAGWSTEMNGFVYAMHEKSGLIDAMRRRSITPDPEWSWSAAEETILYALEAHGIAKGEVILGGFSVHTDKRWIEENYPRLHAFLSHRLVDASVLKTLSKAWGKEWPKEESAHRTIADCREAIRVVQHYHAAIASVDPPAAREAKT